MNIPRTRFGDIVAEFLPPKGKRKKVRERIVIVYGGMPGSPSKKSLLEFFSRKGFWIISPRYRGSWESGGEFLKYSPETDVGIALSHIAKKGIRDLWNGSRYRFTSPQFYVLGISFGGPAAILSLKDKRVLKAVGIAPVVDWRVDSKAEPMRELYRYIRAGFEGAYRMNAKNWRWLSQGKFYNPANDIEKIDGERLLLIHARDDKIVPYKPTAQFARRTGATLITLKRGGHLSSLVVTHKRVYRILKTFLRD